MKTFLFSSLLLLLLASKVGCETIMIHEASDFLRISEDVRNGITYEGTTVLLGNDVDFSGYSEGYHSIGVILDHTFVYFPFCGEFDGQGHVISNFVLNSTERLSGLFGLTNGTPFKNLVMDSSCSITNRHIFDFNIASYSGGLIAYIFPTSTEQQSIIDGCVNMANITFIGDSTNAVRGTTFVGIGGIVGNLMPDVTKVEIRNCVNYGSISFTGTSDIASIGGILGAYFLDSFTSSTKSIIKNCANFGNVTENGSISYMLLIGGIAGISINGLIENCINYGTSYHTKETESIGKIVGGVNDRGTISNCFWTNELDFNKPSGYNMGNPTILYSFLVESNVTIMNELNSWTDANNNEENKYTKWMMLHLNGGNIQKVYGDTPITLRKQVIDPTKKGHNFTYWCIDSYCASGEFSGELEYVTDLYAMWKINSYTLTFDFGNETVISSLCEFNSTITYPDIPKVNGFREWNSSLERMPAHDLVIGPNTTAPEKSKKSNIAVIAGSVGCTFVIVIIVIVIVVLVTVIKKRSRKGYNQIEPDQGDYIGLSNIYPRIVEVIDRDSTLISDYSNMNVEQSIYINLYAKNYNKPSISVALIEAGFDKKVTEKILKRCSLIAENAEKDGHLFDDFTADDAAAVALYTFDFGPGHTEKNPYMLLNKAFTGTTKEELENMRGLLYILMSALRKLPRCRGKLLYRGIQRAVNKNEYREGDIITFHGITSTSTSMSTVKSFLMSSGNRGESSGTLFVIEDGWGYDIQPYSLFPNEKEVLLEPERRFYVKSVIHSDITIVDLKMLDTPLILPEFFGEGNVNAK